MIQTKPEPTCPDCGAIMRLKKPRPDQDWDAFWGCNRYPACKGTMNISAETGKPVGKFYDLDEGDAWDGFEGE